jgi:low temperature requirement protein LtrA
MRPTDEAHRVTSLELFFDLVFVYALTQVTDLMADDPTWRGALRGVLVLGLLWFSWTAFAWLGNQAKADEGLLRAGLVVAMVSVFTVALAMPEAFHNKPGGLYGPLVFAAGFIVARSVHFGVYLLAAGDDAGLRRQLVRTSPPIAAWAALLVAGALAGESGRPVLWALALVVDYVGIFAGGTAGWRLPAPAHFAERHGLIIIIAIGESIVAIGLGAAAVPLAWPTLVAVILGLMVSLALWWTYFDVVATVAERTLVRAGPAERVRLGRDSYTYLHFPMVVGVIYLALGLKKVVTFVADSGQHDLGDPLTGVPLVAMYGGVALYLLAHVAFRLRNVGSVSVRRVVLAVVLLLLIPVAWRLPALAALGLLALLLVGLIAYEAVRYAEARHAVRHASEH